VADSVQGAAEFDKSREVRMCRVSVWAIDGESMKEGVLSKVLVSAARWY